MLRPRIIPCLLVRKKGLIKTFNFTTSKYLGDPINAVRIFNEKEADELIVLDIDATKEGSQPDFSLIKRLAAECRMPLCYGGGIKTVGDAKKIIALGVEKIAISSAALERFEFIAELAAEIGSQSIVVVLDVKKNLFGGYAIYTHNGTKKIKLDLNDAVLMVEKFGAGEILINSISLDGQMCGYDLELARQIRGVAKIPITIMGGAGSLEDISLLISVCGCVGAAAGSLFVFKGPHRAVLINYPNPELREALIHKSLKIEIGRKKVAY